MKTTPNPVVFTLYRAKAVDLILVAVFFFFFFFFLFFFFVALWLLVVGIVSCFVPFVVDLLLYLVNHVYPSRKHAYVNLTPLNPIFSIVKLGFTGVYIIFLISAQKHKLLVLVRTASARRF